MLTNTQYKKGNSTLKNERGSKNVVMIEVKMILAKIDDYTYQMLYVNFMVTTKEKLP